MDRGHWGCPGPGRGGSEKGGHTARRTALRHPGYLSAQGRPPYLLERPTSPPGAPRRRLQDAPPDFRRTRGVSTRRRRPGRLPAEVRAGAAQRVPRFAFRLRRGCPRFPVSRLRTLVESDGWKVGLPGAFPKILQKGRPGPGAGADAGAAKRTEPRSAWVGPRRGPGQARQGSPRRLRAGRRPCSPPWGWRSRRLGAARSFAQDKPGGLEGKPFDGS